ncbi:hypothetical protein LTR70_010682 [Exophiala xenobiotica]|uniref:Uncharacterized protein n=1 Tax=Lithohypha guttulata TaxID=1690604 RepID=A0ABR0JV12_9EURO|nr:hypothetical protein LTR24_010664 [Lithohypha guttulata]KAK5309003.1 hypothetical protein LTR70_010682 [Exophiala xenobiotica]
MPLPSESQTRTPEAVTAQVTLSSNLNTTPAAKPAEPKDADAPPPPSKPKYHVQSIDESYSIFGVDAIWQNQYAVPETDFIAFRKRYHCDIGAMILLVAGHVAQGLYGVISLNATPHMLVVVCGCERMRADLPAGMWDDPSG